MKCRNTWRLFCFTAILLICGGFMYHLQAQGPDIKFDKLTSENTLRVKGLSQNSVLCLIRDSRGFMWIGTWDGLNKYDGYDFNVFSKENGLSNTTINSVLEDDEHDIWIGTDHGLNLLLRESGQIQQFFKAEDNPNSLSANFVNHIYQDRHGMLWISTANGLNRYDKNLGIFTVYNFFNKNADSTRSNYITRVIEDKSGMLWIGTRDGIHYYNPVTDEFRKYELGLKDGSQASFNRNHINDLVPDVNGKLCIATRDGVFFLEPGKGIVGNLNMNNPDASKLSGNQVNAILADQKGRLWIGTSEGLDLFDQDFNHLRSFNAGRNTLSLSNDDVKCIYQDPTGVIWIGTYKGLNKVDQSPSRFTHYYHDTDSDGSLSDNIVYSIVEDHKGMTWIGTYGGVNILNRETERFSVIRHDPKDPGSLSSNKVRNIVIDREGMVWIGTEASGVNRLDPNTGMITHFVQVPGDTNSLTENNILSMMADSKGRIWIGTGKGLTIYDPSTGRFRRITRDINQKIHLKNPLVWTLYEDRHGRFWIGTTEGLHVLAPGLDSITVFTNDPGNSLSISSNRVFSVYEDKDGIYWIGTMGGGLNRYDPVRKEFKAYTEKDGLPNNVVYATLEDEEGSLWLSTNWGISKFNKQTGIFVNYDTKDGVQGNEFNAGAYYKNSRGEMYFGGMMGFNVFLPSEIVLNKIPPRMVLTRFEVFNEPLKFDLDDGEVIRLTYAENFFAIEFSALDFTNPYKNLYRYKLENYDEGWVFATAAQRRAEYRKVNPGTYRFSATGSNNDGVWNTEGIHLTIIISPPWWKSWIFRLAAAILAILVIWSVIYLRINNIRKKHEVEKKMLNIEKQIFELEQKALRLQMNPHFIFNSLNAIQNFVLSNDTDKAVNYLAKFSHLMRMILANSIATRIPLKDDLKALTFYIDLEKLRFDDKFTYEVTIDPSIDEEFIEIPPMLFQPYVENAIIHGLVNSPKPGRLSISMQLVGKGTMRCVIEDNGIGREKATEIRAKSGIKRQPRGMIITQERLEILNKQSNKNFSVRITDLKDKEGNAAGTRIELDIQYREI